MWYWFWSTLESKDAFCLVWQLESANLWQTSRICKRSVCCQGQRFWEGIKISQTFVQKEKVDSIAIHCASFLPCFPVLTFVFGLPVFRNGRQRSWERGGGGVVGLRWGGAGCCGGGSRGKWAKERREGNLRVHPQLRIQRLPPEARTPASHCGLWIWTSLWR